MTQQRDRGSVSIEMTMLVWPVTVIMATLIAAGWMLAAARQQVHSAAGSAARAASLQPHPAGAVAAAEQQARDALTGAGRRCGGLTITVDTASFAPGGHVEVTVRCQTDLRGLAGLDLPGTVTFEASARAPIERHRELGRLP